MIATRGDAGPASTWTKTTSVLGTINIGDIGVDYSQKLQKIFKDKEFTTLRVVHFAQTCGSTRLNKFALQAGDMFGCGFLWTGGLILTLETGVKVGRNAKGVTPYGCAALTVQENENKVEGGLVEAGKALLYKGESSRFYDDPRILAGNPLRILYKSLDALRKEYLSDGEGTEQKTADQYAKLIGQVSMLSVLAHVAEYMCNKSENESAALLLRQTS